MRFKDQVRFVRQNMKKNRLRLFMTVLATAMGCAFLIVLASVGFGLQKSIVEDVASDRLVTVIEVWGKQESGNEPLTEEDLAYFRTLDRVKAVTFSMYVAQSLKPAVDGEEATTLGYPIAVDFAEERKAGFELFAGRLPEAANEVVVGYQAREESPEIWIGKTLELQVLTYDQAGEEVFTPLEATIVGVKAKPTKEWESDSGLYIDMEMLNRIEATTGTRLAEAPHPSLAEMEDHVAPPTLDDPRTYTSVKVLAESAQYVKGLGEQLREKDFYIYSLADELKQVNMLFLIMKIGLIFVGTIAVLIASIGIFNTMTMAVTERAQDIGIMKAIGAHPSTIRRIFLLESGWIGTLGAFIGAVVAYGISAAVNVLLPILLESSLEERVPEGFLFTYIPPYLTAIACGISLGVAMLSGWRPAARATRIDVLRALRRDL
ncbi:ABC transporter permease [Paenibacillus sp. TRM 82003]|nr:ABC transporter permease [Paenibacillus sp. TRM 82003]